MSNNPSLEARQASLEDLQQQIRACRLCEIHGYIPRAQPLVHGQVENRMMVIGQAPGHRSVENNLSFSGPGGRLLQKWLEQAGFPPGYLHEHVYLSSLTHCDPGKSLRGDGDRKPSPQEITLCRPHLEAEMELVRPKVILPVGGMAIEAFWGKGRMEEIIGQYRQQGETLLLPLPHPSGVSRWLNPPAHQHLLRQALALLAEWRVLYQL